MSLSKGNTDKQKILTIASLPTAPATAVRLRFFQPSTKPVKITSDWLDCPWGKCRVTGRLGQRHADLIDTCMYEAIDTDTVNGRLHLLIDPYTIRRKMGSGTQFSYEGTRRLFNEIMQCIVDWETPHSKGMGHIIDAVRLTCETRRNPLNQGKRELWQVTFGEAWTKLIYDDIKLKYDPGTVISLKYGITQAVARILLSHNHKRMRNGIRISTLFEWFGIPKGQARWKHTFNLKEDADKLRSIGFEIDGDFIKPINTDA